jgi:hypothetical protein
MPSSVERALASIAIGGELHDPGDFFDQQAGDA